MEAGLSSQEICKALNADDELPFGAYSSSAGIAPRDLARLLRPYGIKSKDVWVGGKSAKGYRRDQFTDAWQRYTPRSDPPEKGREGREGRDPSAGAGLDIAPEKRKGRCENSDEQGDLADLALIAPSETPRCAAGEPVQLDIFDCIRVAEHGLDGKPAASHNEGGPERTAAELSDDELLAIFPGATIETGDELPGDIAPCGCRQRTREWRLRGEAMDVAYTYVSRRAFTEAVEQGRKVMPKGPRSGWGVETSPTSRGHRWICALCHPPADGLEAEFREAQRVDGKPTSPTGRTWPTTRWGDDRATDRREGRR